MPRILGSLPPILPLHKNTGSASHYFYERVKGVGPSSHPWEGCILPVNHTRTMRPVLIITNFIIFAPNESVHLI